MSFDQRIGAVWNGNNFIGVNIGWVAMTAESEAEGTLEVAIRNTERLLEIDPKLALEQGQEILNQVPNYPPAQLLLVTALRHCGNFPLALERISAVLPAQVNWAAAHYEHALLLACLGRGDEAIAGDCLQTT